MISVFEHPWLNGLFGADEAKALWSADAQLAHFRAFEAALAHALEASGRVPAGHGAFAAARIETAEIDFDRLSERTGIDGLPVPELVRQLRHAAGEYESGVHTGATSQDVMDTALALTLKKITDLLLSRLGALDAELAQLLKNFGGNSLMGRTRMQAALPITARDRIVAWRAPIASHIEALNALRSRTERLQLGGPVGTRASFGGDGPAIATHMAQALELEETGVWHTDRTNIADYASRLSLITGHLGKIGKDIALMAQQGIDEIAIAGGGGSSAMPHKSNPILAELLVTLAGFNAAQLSGMHQALVHEQERSGTAWALEWMILPGMACATDRGLTAALELLRKIERIGGV